MVSEAAAKLVIWDWNGTLLDDAVLCFTVANLMRRARRMPELADLSAYRSLFRFPIIEYYRAMGYTFETESFDEISVEFHALYETRVNDCPLYADAKATLEAVRARGIGQVLLSVTAQPRLERQARMAGVDGYFSRICGQGDDLGAGKAEMARRLVEASGVARASIVFVGDTDHDAEIAQSLGCRAVLLTCGHQTRPMLEKCGAPLIDALSALPALL